jgi:hypothetical protein
MGLSAKQLPSLLPKESTAMVVTGIFHMEWEGRIECHPLWAKPSANKIYEEKIGEKETLVAVRARNLRQAMLLSYLLSQAGARRVEIDAEAA